jgi:hypothetical protein
MTAHFEATPALTMDRFEAIRNTFVQLGSNRNAIAQFNAFNAQFRAMGSAIAQIACGA